MMSDIIYTAMKLLYFFLFLLTLMVGGYLWLNEFSFDNISFSNYLIKTLFILLLSCLVLVIGIYSLVVQRRRSNRDVMTIRQYYDYKSAR